MDKKKDLLIVLFLLILSLIFFWKVILLQEVAFPLDILANLPPWGYLGKVSIHNYLLTDPFMYAYPERFQVSSVIREGNIPLWNPYVLCGFPQIANITAGIFYPLNFFFYLSPSLLTYSYLTIFHLFLAGVFMYFYLQVIKAGKVSSLAGAITFMFNGFLLTRLELTPFLNVCIWIPLVFLLAEKTIETKDLFYALLTGLVLGIIFLAGMPQVSYYIVIATFFYFIFRALLILREDRNYKTTFRLIYLLLATLLVSLSLAAVQLLPSLEITSQTVRVAESWKSLGGLPPQNLITFFLPDFFGNPVSDNFWGKINLVESCGYIGVFPLILILFAFFKRDRYTLFFALLLLLSLLLSMNTYLYKLFYDFIPGFNRFRGPSRFLYLYAFSASILAAKGLDFILKQRIEDKTKARRLIITTLSVITILLFVIGLLWYYIQRQENLSLVTLYQFERLNLGTFLALIGCSLTLLVFYFKRKIKMPLFISLILIIIILDLFMFGMKFNPLCKRELALFKTDCIKFLESRGDLYRVIRFGGVSILIPNTALIYKIPDAQGSEELLLREYGDFLNLIEEQESWLQRSMTGNILSLQALKSKLVDLLSVKYILTSREIIDGKFDLVFDKEIRIYKNKGCLPRSFIVYKAKIIGDKRKILEELKSENFDPRECVILEKKPQEKFQIPNSKPQTNSKFNPVSSTGQNSKFEAQIVKYSPNEVIIEANLDKRGFLVLSDTYYPGWEVYVDGKKDKIYKANYCFRAVALGKGKHKIRFIYNPLSFKVGLYVSLTTLLLILSFIAYTLAKGRRR